jgi:hypothetical protein
MSTTPRKPLTSGVDVSPPCIFWDVYEAFYPARLDPVPCTKSISILGLLDLIEVFFTRTCIL